MTTRKHIAAILAPRESVDHVYGTERISAIARRVRFIGPDPFFDNERLVLGDTDTTSVDILFSTWGISRLTGEQLDRFFPNLRAVFYAAGTVGHFAAPFLERHVTIVSAWKANAVSVAQYTVAQIVLAMKGYFRNVQDYDGSHDGFARAFRGRGLYGETIGLLGAGAIGRRVIDLLKAYEVDVIVWDPFLSQSTASALGVEKVNELEDLFSRAYVVSNHLADKPETVGLISRVLLDKLRQDAVFINTGRGPTVDEVALIDLLEKRPDLTALLDVTDPEPPGPESRLMRTANIHVTSHIAGTIGDEVRRMSDLCIEELDRYLAGQPLQHQITQELMATLA